MRVKKSEQLRCLLRVQDVVLAMVEFALCVDLAWIVGIVTWKQLVAHLWLTGFVGGLAVAASFIISPRLHGRTFAEFLWDSLGYTGIVVTGLLILNGLGESRWIDGGIILIFACALTVTLLLNRCVLKWWYLHGHREHRANHIKVVVIGSGNRARRLINAYRENTEWEIDVVARIEPDVTAERADEFGDDGPLIYGSDSIDGVLSNNVVDEVIVCVPRSMLKDVELYTAASLEHGVCVKFMADLFDVDARMVSLEKIGSIPILTMDTVAMRTTHLITKRFLDLFVAICALMVLWPIFVVVAICIKLDSRGPVFFVQQRVGLNKRTFQMIKFRSMRRDSQEVMAQLEALNEAKGPIFKMTRDPRVTRVGKFIRHWSLDELPQLFNVVLGHMAFVGPRPMSMRDVQKFNIGLQHKRFSVRPGLACLREVEGRSNLTFDRWLELDLEYIDKWSLGLDLKIMMRMIPAVLSGRGAV